MVLFGIKNWANGAVLKSGRFEERETVENNRKESYEKETHLHIIARVSSGIKTQGAAVSEPGSYVISCEERRVCFFS